MTEKDEICEKFDNVIEESKKKVEEMETLVNDDLSAMIETITVLNDMKEAMENMNLEENAHEDIMGKMNTINGIEENINTHLSGTREYVYNHYISRQEIRRMVKEKRVAVKLDDSSSCDESDESDSDDVDDSDDNDNAVLSCEGVFLYSFGLFLSPFGTSGATSVQVTNQKLFRSYTCDVLLRFIDHQLYCYPL